MISSSSPCHCEPMQVLHKLSERITSQLRTELSDHMRREMVLETEKKAELAGKIDRCVALAILPPILLHQIPHANGDARCDSYLQTELQTHTCPVCYELMAPPHKAPMLLFPCGHSFCKQCIDSHTARGANTCPYCREPVSSHGAAVSALLPAGEFVGAEACSTSCCIAVPDSIQSCEPLVEGPD